MKTRHKPQMGDVLQAAVGLQEVRVEPRLAMKDLRLEKLAAAEVDAMHSSRLDAFQQA